MGYLFDDHIGQIEDIIGPLGQLDEVRSRGRSEGERGAVGRSHGWAH